MSPTPRNKLPDWISMSLGVGWLAGWESAFQHVATDMPKKVVSIDTVRIWNFSKYNL
jgi:hypothetical protein